MIRRPEAEALRNHPAALVAVGDDGLIAFANPEALRLLGWDHNLIGKPVSVMVPLELRETQREAYADFVLTRRVTAYPRVQPALGKDGRVRQVHIDVAGFERPDGSLFLCSVLADPRGPQPAVDGLAQRLAEAGYRRIPADAWKDSR